MTVIAQSTPPRLISVGTKLAAATIALIVASTIGVYVALSHTQRENLLRSKETSTSALTQLFADSCAAGLVFGDEQAIKDALATLGHNGDVEYAAVWGAEATEKVTRMFGELKRRGTVAAIQMAPKSAVITRENERIVVESSILDPKGVVVGATAVAYSLARENQAIANVKKNTLLGSTVVALALVLLLVLMARSIIVSPLSKLVAAANEIGSGGKGEVNIHTRDEVGRLAGAFREMVTAIREREERIAARNRDIRLVLDNVGQGFITLEVDGTVSQERSRVVDEWFGAMDRSQKFWEYLTGRVEGDLGKWFEMGWEMIQDDFLPLPLTLEQLPKVAKKDGRAFELAYRPILHDERLAKLIVVITDVTARIERERAERSQREMMSIFRRMLTDRTGLNNFFSEMGDIIGAVVKSRGDDLDLTKRHIHTVKGNAALFGIESVAELCHEIEDRMSDPAQAGEGLSTNDRERLERVWGKVLAMRGQLSDGASEEGIELNSAEYTDFVAKVRRGLTQESLVQTVDSWKFEPAAKRLSIVGEQIRTLAVRLDRAPVKVVCEAGTLRLPPEKWKGFWSAFAHVVRNTVDHGIETASERATTGKPSDASVRLSITTDKDRVLVSIRDDGKGINWERIAARAKEHGLPFATPEDLKAALFADGVSARTEVSATSGRGVGLSVLRDFVNEVGGHIDITTELGKGTEFRFVLPQTMLSEAPTRRQISPPPVGRLAGVA